MKNSTEKKLLEPYQKHWPADFEALKGVLENALEGLEIAIEHVGSTSVPELAAKPIIDLDIVRLGGTTLAEVNARLASLGYFHNGNQGIADREAFRRHPNQAHRVLDQFRHHLYVCPENSRELQRHLTFRDFLRENAGKREEYAVLKAEIAAEANQDHAKYAELKEKMASAFIEDILKGCE